MNMIFKKGIQFSLLLSISAFAADIDYILEAHTVLAQSHSTSFANTDGSSSQNKLSDVVATAMLAPIYEDKHPISLSLFLNSASIDPVRLEIGGEYILSDNIKYEANFLGRAIFKTSENTSLFFGGKFGVGESAIKKHSITFIGQNIFNGTSTVEIPLSSTAKYSVAGGNIGCIYSISKNLEWITLGEVIGRTSDLSDDIDKGSVASAASASGMNPLAILSMLEAIGPQTVISWTVNTGLRIRF